GRHPRTRNLLCRCTALRSRKPFNISFCSTAARHHERNARRAKTSYTTAPSGATSGKDSLYAGGMGFSTWGSTDKMVREGTPMRIRIGVATLLLGVVAVGATVVGAPQAQAPHDPQIIDVQGYQKLVRQYHGKPLLINFWATWCEPCRDEYPMLNELAKEYAPKGLRVVGVDSDQDGDLILMRRFIARYKPVFPNYRRKPVKPEAEAEFNQAVLPEWRGELPAT